MPPIRLAMIDAELATRELPAGLAEAAGIIDLVAISRRIRDAEEFVFEFDPHVMVVEATQIPFAGPGFLRSLRGLRAGMHVLVIVDDADDAELVEWFAAGAMGCIERVHLAQELTAAVQAICRGEAWIPRRLVSVLLERLARVGAARARLPRST